MTIDPDQIRAKIDAMLTQLPDSAGLEDLTGGSFLAHLGEIALRFSEAHDLLLQALESVEKG
ncbi:hypothetical protein MUBE_14025 [Mycobacterium uberis]|uniref:Uncharacterized protein n=1 Tax=Mycobacterium uberis TaxID=2162698 RepID=A0A3E1HCM7_9MYCO|nr:hypothetical protein [Mycobacterium uberis]RFD24218.1 hypothetical protein MUBE_14025 [Mycobacterium uberis]